MQCVLSYRWPSRSCRPYIRPDGIYVKSFFLFSLNVLQTTTSCLQVVPVPQLQPAPEDWLPAAGAHLVSYYIPEICSENERDLKRQNLLPFFRYKTSWDTCQVELYLDPAASCFWVTRDASSLPERERGFARERERDPAAPAPLPGHRTTKREQIGGQETRTRITLPELPVPEPAGPAAVTTDRWPRTRNEERETEDQ